MRSSTRLALFAAALLASVTGAQASLNGTLYAVVSPAFDGSNGSTSFLRLFGGVAKSSTFTVSVVRTADGATLGTATYAVPKNASLQYDLGSILAKANAQAAVDHGYALYIQNPEPTAGYEHVTYNQVSLLFENVGNCQYTLNEVVKAYYPSLVATNLHTTALANNTYPTQIDLHNYWNAQVSYGVYVYDAANGNPVGTGSKVYPVAANSTKSLSVAQLQSDIGFTPTASQPHVNIIVTDVANQAPAEMLGILIGTTLGGAINMSMACAVNAPPAPVSTGGGTIGGDGGGAYLN